jgi:organic radical activating enzyme
MDTELVHLDEIFFSLQGEGGEIGRPHLFLRLAGCPLRCSYCDTPRSWTRRAEWELHLEAETRRAANPLDAAALERALAAACADRGAAAAEVTLAVTGGEPLEQAEFLRGWLPRWPGRVLLETAGLWPERLRGLLPLVDAVSLDWKLASTLRAGAERVDPGGCIAALRDVAKPRWWVKLVVHEGCADAEPGAALERIAALAPGAEVFLQPVAPAPRGPRPPSAARLLGWALRGEGLGLAVRAVPQVHPLLGAR